MREDRSGHEVAEEGLRRDQSRGGIETEEGGRRDRSGLEVATWLLKKWSRSALQRLVSSAACLRCEDKGFRFEVLGFKV